MDEHRDLYSHSFIGWVGFVDQLYNDGQIPQEISDHQRGVRSMADEKNLESIANLDRIVHSPPRLMILAYLAAVENADFIFLMNQVNLTRGNLSSHLNTLEEAGYVSINKEFIDKVPRTIIQLTPTGRKAVTDYRDQMRTVIDQLLKS
jgi:DNA-binding MarR family transcriptional regulator